MESGALIAATNWIVLGGVDCSYMQRRVYESYYADVPIIKRAFDGRYQISLAARTTQGRHDRFRADYGRGNEIAWRLAVAYRNYPYGAEQTAKGAGRTTTRARPRIGSRATTFTSRTDIRCGPRPNGSSDTGSATPTTTSRGRCGNTFTD